MWRAASGATPWQQIVTSPLRRCREFAETLSQKLQIPLEQEEQFKEVGFGAWEGKTGDELRSQDPDILKRFYHDPIANRPVGAEPLEHFSNRVNAAMERTIRRHAGKHILVVAHAGVIRASLTQLMSAPLASMYRLSIASASISRIRIDQERPPTIVFSGRRSV
jgi:broad specificity phosphatase PhoE